MTSQDQEVNHDKAADDEDDGGATNNVVDNDQLLAYVTKKQTKKATGSVSKLLTATHGGKRSVPRKTKNS